MSVELNALVMLLYDQAYFKMEGPEKSNPHR